MVDSTLCPLPTRWTLRNVTWTIVVCRNWRISMHLFYGVAYLLQIRVHSQVIQSFVSIITWNLLFVEFVIYYQLNLTKHLIFTRFQIIQGFVKYDLQILKILSKVSKITYLWLISIFISQKMCCFQNITPIIRFFSLAKISFNFLELFS